MITTEELHKLIEKGKQEQIQAIKDDVAWCSSTEHRMDDPILNKCNIRKHGRCSFRKCMFFSHLPFLRNQIQKESKQCPETN